MDYTTSKMVVKGQRTLQNGLRLQSSVEFTSSGDKRFNVTTFPDRTIKCERVEFKNGEKRFNVTFLPDRTIKCERQEFARSGDKRFNVTFFPDGVLKCERQEFADGNKQFNVTTFLTCSPVSAQS